MVRSLAKMGFEDGIFQDCFKQHSFQHLVVPSFVSPFVRMARGKRSGCLIIIQYKSD